jgi:hypothetical protein
MPGGECREHRGTQPEGRASWRQSVLEKNEEYGKAEADQAVEGVYRDYRLERQEEAVGIVGIRGSL